MDFLARGRSGLIGGWDEGVSPTGRTIRRVIALSPVLFTAFVGAYSRAYHDTYEVPSNTAAKDAQILAYVPYLKEAKRALHEADSNPNALVQVARRWSEAADRGELVTLLPSSYEELAYDDARDQVLHTQMKVVNALLNDDWTSGTDKAFKLERAVLALRLASSAKFSDLNAAREFGSRQRRALAMLRRLAPSLEQRQRELLRHEIARGIEGPQRLQHLTEISRLQYVEFLRRSSQTPLTQDQIRQIVRLTDEMASAHNRRSPLTLAAAPLPETQAEVPDFLADLRMAWGQERTTLKAAQELIQALDAPHAA